MNPRRIDVFFYGLFMDADALRAKGVEPINPRRACVPGFTLRIGQRATLVPDPTTRVYGVLMELSSDEIDRVYAEPGVREYRPEAVITELDDGTRVPALCFNLPVPPGLDEMDREYARRLRDLALRLGLPASYVERIGMTISIVCLLTLTLACAFDPRHVPEPAVHASGACAQSLAEVREALFRYMFDHNESAFQKDVSYFFLRVEGGTDPEPELLARFKSHVPVVEPVSRTYLTARGEPHHGNAELRALFFGIDKLECTNDNAAVAEGGYYEGNLSASGHEYRVIRKDGKWIVVEDKRLQTSSIIGWSIL
jgi:hypothetical protein